MTEQDGQTAVHLYGTAVECTASDCPAGPGSFATDVAVQLCNLGILPAACGSCECCRRPTFELFTGTELNYVGPNPLDYCKLGGRGRAMGEAGLCLLRDLAQAARGPSTGGPGIHLERSGSLGIGSVSVRQHVGFVDFDLPTRRMRGFHSVSVCAPVLGCINNQVQPFTATLHQEPGASGDCGDYQFRNPWLLRVDTEQIEHNVGVDIGPITVFTPIGPVNITPRFNYELNLEPVTSPWAGGNARTMRVRGSCFRSRLYDVLDAGGGVLASVVAGGNSLGYGWDALLGLGGRDPDPAGAIWSPPAEEFPERPDFDFSVARDGDEKRPTGRFLTGVDVNYPIGSLASKLDVPPFDLERAEVFVRSSLDAAFSSQFGIAFDEGRSQTIVDCTPTRSLTVLQLQSAVDAIAQIGVEAGVDIEFTLDLGFYEKHFRVNPKVNVIDPGLVSSNPQVGPDAYAEIDVSAPPPPGSGPYDAFTSFSAGPGNGRAFVDACLAEPPPPPQEVPTPTVEPGDPLDLIEAQEFPCNICLYFPGLVTQACVPKASLVGAGAVPPDYVCDLAINGLPCTDPSCENVTVSPPVAVDLKEVLFPISQASLPADKRWMCDAFEKFGCFDLCRYDPAAAQPLTLVQSAVDKVGTRCRDATGGSDSKEGMGCSNPADCDDGNPCTQDDCRLEGEFYLCRITPKDGACDDGLYCNGADTCALGICGAHAGNPCAATAACCDEAADACPASCPNLPCAGTNDGDACDDGTACTDDDRCVDTLAGLQCRGNATTTCPSSPCTAGLCEDAGGTPECTSVPSGACPPECGDNGLDPGEECDGTADAACPGECQPDCSCTPPGQRTGEPCTDPGECASGYCADGVCCDTACDGPAVQCNLPAQAGTCTEVAAPAPAVSSTALLAALGALLAVAWAAWRRRVAGGIDAGHGR